MKFKKINKYYKDLRENPTLKMAKKEFKDNIGSIKKGESKIVYQKTKFDKKLSKFKKRLDKGLGY